MFELCPLSTAIHRRFARRQWRLHLHALFHFAHDPDGENQVKTNEWDNEHRPHVRQQEKIAAAILRGRNAHREKDVHTAVTSISHDAVKMQAVFSQCVSAYTAILSVNF